MLSQQHIATLYTHMRRVRKPIIAAVNGAAAGGGLAFALASDIRVCSESAKFNVAFVKIGLSGCDVGVSYLLPRLIGASKAFEMMLTGRYVLADEADRIGLVSRVVPDGQTVDAAIEIADQIIGELAVRRLDDEGSHVGEPRDGEHAGRDRSREPDADPHDVHRGPSRSDARLPREAGTRVPQPLATRARRSLPASGHRARPACPMA